MNESEKTEDKTYFAPHLFLRNVAAGMEFYIAAFGAIELRRWSNDDGSVHVAEMELNGALFHLHEEVARQSEYSPQTLKGTACSIGLFTRDVDLLMKRAIAAGARETHPPRDYDYGYRQGTVVDPEGHHWLIQKKII
jgi:PhnB protein